MAAAAEENLHSLGYNLFVTKKEIADVNTWMFQWFFAIYLAKLKPFHPYFENKGHALADIADEKEQSM